MSSPRFRVEIEANGCEHCKGGRSWVVVDSVRDCATGRVFHDEEAANDLVNDMNYAYGLSGNVSGKIEDVLRIYHATHLVIQESGEGFRIDAHFSDKQAISFAGPQVSAAVDAMHYDVDIPF